MHPYFKKPRECYIKCTLEDTSEKLGDRISASTVNQLCVSTHQEHDPFQPRPEGPVLAALCCFHRRALPVLHYHHLLHTHFIHFIHSQRTEEKLCMEKCDDKSICPALMDSVSGLRKWTAPGKSSSV